MAVVWVPALLRELAQGQEQVSVPGETVRELIDRLEEHFPGMRERLCENGRLRHSIAVVVDGSVSHQGLRRRLAEDSQVRFMPAMKGG